MLHPAPPITSTQASLASILDGNTVGPGLCPVFGFASLGMPSTTYPCMVLPSTSPPPTDSTVLPSMGSTGLQGVQFPSTLGYSCPTQTVPPYLQRKEDRGLARATEGADHQEDSLPRVRDKQNLPLHLASELNLREKHLRECSIHKPGPRPGLRPASLGR